MLIVWTVFPNRKVGDQLRLNKTHTIWVIWSTNQEILGKFWRKISQLRHSVSSNINSVYSQWTFNPTQSKHALCCIQKFNINKNRILRFHNATFAFLDIFTQASSIQFNFIISSTNQNCCISLAVYFNRSISYLRPYCRFWSWEFVLYSKWFFPTLCEII